MMESLQILPLCFLLITTQSSSKFHDFKCEDEENVTAEIGKTFNITCQNNQAIEKATVKFCPIETSCPNKSDLSTIKNKYTTDNGRISMTMMNRSVILHIHKVQISDQRYYKILLEAVNGHVEIYRYLKVLAPYSEPQIKIKNDTVECTASGGHPQRQLYWFDDHGTNLTHISKLVSLKNEDGSFSLNSTLQRQSLDNSTICCSILSNYTNCDRPQGFARVQVGYETTTNKVPQDAEKKIFIPVLIVVIVAICTIMVFYCRKNKDAIRNAYRQRLFLFEGTSVTNQIEANAMIGSRNTLETVTLQDSEIQIEKARDSV